MASKKQLKESLVKYLKKHAEEIAEEIFDEVFANQVQRPNKKNSKTFISTPENDEGNTVVETESVGKSKKNAGMKKRKGLKGGSAFVFLGDDE